MPSSPPHSQDEHFRQQPIKTHNKKKIWTGMQNDVVQPNVNEVKQCQSTRNMPQPQQKKSFIFFHITVIQCPAVASIHDYISTKGGGERGQCMIVA